MVECYNVKQAGTLINDLKPQQFLPQLVLGLNKLYVVWSGIVHITKYKDILLFISDIGSMAKQMQQFGFIMP